MIDSLIESEKGKTEELNEKAFQVEKCEEGANLIKECENDSNHKGKHCVLHITKAIPSRGLKKKRRLPRW